MKKILLITNSYPYSGEQFLKTEINFLPEEMTVDVWPFFVDRSKTDLLVPQRVTVHPYTVPSFGLKIRCALNVMKTLIETGEVRAAVAKPNPLRNTIKTLKFAYISEIRLAMILKWIKETDAVSEDTIIYSYWMYEVAYVAAKLKERYPTATFITRCHGYDLYEERHKGGYLPYRSFITSQADAIFTISQNGKIYLHDKYGGRYDQKVIIARLGTVRLYDVCQVQRLPQEIVLVSCSNLVQVKRVHKIISALSKTNENIKWVHFGNGCMEEFLKEQAKKLPSNVKYQFMGSVENKVIQKYYSTHTITAFVNVSESEGIPVSIMEAQSYAIPVIATDVGGTSEIVLNDVNGVLLKKDFEDKELLNAIQKVKMNWRRYSSNAIETWTEMSNAQNTASEFYKNLEIIAS